MYCELYLKDHAVEYCTLILDHAFSLSAFEFQSVLRDFSKKELDWKVSFIPMLKRNVCSCWLILTTYLYFNQDEIESKGAMVFDYANLICDPGRRNILYYWLNFTASEQRTMCIMVLTPCETFMLYLQH